MGGKTFLSQNAEKTRLKYLQNPKLEREGLFFFLSSPDFIAPEALDDILVTAVTPDLKERVARPTPVLRWALSLRRDICSSQLWQWLMSDGEPGSPAIQLIKSTPGAAMVICPP